MRIFRTCRVMNISTVAVYTHVDRGALHVRYAEEAYCISESPEDTSYLKPELILSIAKKTGAAIHPGYGFLSENADFARRCEEEGVIFIGPSADIISKMGIKTEARKIMREAGLPIVPGTETPVQGIDEVKKVANEVGYPIMLKALAGGGGKGMRLVRTEEEVETALRLSQSEAGTSFGNDAVYIENILRIRIISKFRSWEISMEMSFICMNVNVPFSVVTKGDRRKSFSFCERGDEKEDVEGSRGSL